MTTVPRVGGPTAPGPSAASPTASPSLPTWRLHLMRVGYLVMAVGLAFVKWPLFFREGGVAALPAFEGVVATILSAMSLLAIVGLRRPVLMLPLLVLESLWKVIWVATVALPHVISGTMDDQLTNILISVSVVVVIIAVTPWDQVWKRYLR